MKRKWHTTQHLDDNNIIQIERTEKRKCRANKWTKEHQIDWFRLDAFVHWWQMAQRFTYIYVFYKYALKLKWDTNILVASVGWAGWAGVSHLRNREMHLYSQNIFFK